jgi:hypothetical protein
MNYSHEGKKEVRWEISKVRYMDIAYISALAALAGSVVGGPSGLTTWLSQRAQARAGQLAREMSR